MYCCKECKLAVIYLDGKLIRGCKCNAPVIVDLKAEAKGSGGLKQR